MVDNKGFIDVLLLGADHLTSPSRRQSHRRTAKRRYPGPTAVLISSTGNGRSSADAVEFVALMRHLRPACRLGDEPDVRDRHQEYLGRAAKQGRVWPRPNHYTRRPRRQPTPIIVGMLSGLGRPLDLNKGSTASRAACAVANENRARRTERIRRSGGWSGGCCAIGRSYPIAGASRGVTKSMPGCGEGTERTVYLSRWNRPSSCRISS
jgi:hypothetical protein